MTNAAVKLLKKGDVILTKWGQDIEQDIFDRIVDDDGMETPRCPQLHNLKMRIKTKYWQEGWLHPSDIIMILDMKIE